MEERTTDEVATLFKTAADSVYIINTDKQSYQTDTEYKERIKRNVVHLETIKTYKKIDGTTSIWTSEDFTAIDAAITKGNGLL